MTKVDKKLRRLELARHCRCVTRKNSQWKMQGELSNHCFERRCLGRHLRCAKPCVGPPVESRQLWAKAT
jgi:hypothetical protein